MPTLPSRVKCRAYGDGGDLETQGVNDLLTD
ncbi:hypothetical protein H4W29_005460 [Rhizobium viscosum]|uniref:Uncharacterized protein n=1 Tax=Rhizobium viscosum TaxID=1673 RepID=A0ABR9IYC1_RHIVS|nr:hypothetical protein [Rhizobium viscosum]